MENHVEIEADVQVFEQHEDIKTSLYILTAKLEYLNCDCSVEYGVK